MAGGRLSKFSTHMELHNSGFQMHASYLEQREAYLGGVADGWGQALGIFKVELHNGDALLGVLGQQAESYCVAQELERLLWLPGSCSHLQFKCDLRYQVSLVT